jgi:hypothetical protein
MRIVIRVITILLLTTLVVGCPMPIFVTDKSQLYSGPERQKEQISVIKWKMNYNFWVYYSTFSELEVHAVDGQSVNGKIKNPTSGRSSEIYVLPGVHEVNWSLAKRAGVASCVQTLPPVKGYIPSQTLKFEAEAGHTYKIDHPIYWHKGSAIKIVDEATGEVVASYVIEHYDYEDH